MSETLALLKQLIACPSVTPDEAGCFDVVEATLVPAGFQAERLTYPDASNLWLTKGPGPYWVINGHVDVVPPGPTEAWTSPPFEPTIHGDHLVGRGACDMKASVAAAVVALSQAQASNVALLLTSDEEGPAHDGTSRALDELIARGIQFEGALVIEPTSVEVLGDAYKPGRRGSLTGYIEVKGIQGHVAYPERADNAAHLLAPALAELVATEWDRGDDYFPPSTMQVFELQAGVGASNVIPGVAKLGINFRHGPASLAASLIERVESIFASHDVPIETHWTIGADPFLCPPGQVAQRIIGAVESVLDRTPTASTGGGTSDARAFAARGIEVAEFGPVPIRMHGIDEAVWVSDLAPLAVVYQRWLEG